jgi:HPr kinase/phosphorylase
VAGAPPTKLHGALVDVDGMGVLLLGRSGIGKSECALELVSRGHRLVADDIVELRNDAEGRLIGSAPERVRDEMPIDLVCQLEKWTEGADYERIGLERSTQRIGDVELPRVTLPARPGGSMATVIEVAARDQRQRARGVNAARQLDAKLRSEMQES